VRGYDLRRTSAGRPRNNIQARVGETDDSTRYKEGAPTQLKTDFLKKYIICNKKRSKDQETKPPSKRNNLRRRGELL